ncbi:MAG: hypothetical protein ACRC1W_14955 [Shewanella sp.]
MIQLTQNQAKALLLFCAKEDMRHYFNAVFFEVNDSNEARATATDGYRMIRFPVKLEMPKDITKPSKAQSFMVSRELIEIIEKTKPKTKDGYSASIALSGELSAIKGRQVTAELATGRTINDFEVSGKYPECDQVLPIIKKPCLSVVSISDTFSLDAVKAEALLSSAKKRPALLRIAEESTLSDIQSATQELHPNSGLAYAQFEIADQLKILRECQLQSAKAVYFTTDEASQSSDSFNRTSIAIMPVRN